MPSDWFWRIEPQPEGLRLTKNERAVTLPWPFLARVTAWKGPEHGPSPVAFPDPGIDITIDAHGLNIRMPGETRAIRLPRPVLLEQLEKRP